MVTGQAVIHPVILSAVVILLPYRMENGSLAMVLLPGRLWQNTAVAHLSQLEEMVSSVKYIISCKKIFCFSENGLKMVSSCLAD